MKPTPHLGSLGGCNEAVKESRINVALNALGATIGEVDNRIDRLEGRIARIMCSGEPTPAVIKDPPPEGNSELERDINQHRRSLERVRERITAITDSVEL